jgi:hypothetical protein
VNQSIQLARLWITLDEVKDRLDNVAIPLGSHLSLDDPELMTAMEELSERSPPTSGGLSSWLRSSVAVGVSNHPFFYARWLSMSHLIYAGESSAHAKVQSEQEISMDDSYSFEQKSCRNQVLLVV